MNYSTSPHQVFAPVPLDQGRPFLAMAVDDGADVALWIQHGAGAPPAVSSVPWLTLQSDPVDPSGRISRITIMSSRLAPGDYLAALAFGDETLQLVVRVGRAKKGEDPLPAARVPPASVDGTSPQRQVAGSQASSSPPRAHSPLVIVGSLVILVLLAVLVMGQVSAHSASLELSTDPPGARVLLDGVERGVAPLTLRWLSPGTRRLEILHPDSHPETMEVALASLSTTRHSVHLSPKTLIVDCAGNGAFATVSEAVQQARPGSTIVVRPGVYQEALVLDKDLQIQGEGAREGIVLTGSEAAPVLVQSGTVGIKGLTIQFEPSSSDMRHPALWVEGGSLALEGCRVRSSSWASMAVSNSAAFSRIEDCEFPRSGGSGLYVYGGARAEVVSSALSESTLAGVEVTGSSAVTFGDCTLTDGKEGGVYVHGEGATATLEDCRVLGNRFSGIEAKEQGRVVVLRTKVQGNGEHAVYVHERGSAEVRECDLRSNGRSALLEDGTGKLDSSDNVE